MDIDFPVFLAFLRRSCAWPPILREIGTEGLLN